MPYNPCCCGPGTCTPCSDSGDSATVMMAFSGSATYASTVISIPPYCGDDADGSWEIGSRQCVTIGRQLPVRCGTDLNPCGTPNLTTTVFTVNETIWGRTYQGPFAGPPFYSGSCAHFLGTLNWSWYAWVQLLPVPELDGFHVEASLSFAWNINNASFFGSSTATWCQHLHTGLTCTGRVFTMGNHCGSGPFSPPITCTITM